MNIELKYDQALEVIVGLSNDIQELKEIIADRTNDIIHQQKEIEGLKNELDHMNKIAFEQEKEIEQLKNKLLAKETLDRNTKVLIRQQAKKVKHLFPLERTTGYGQLCALVLHFEKALEEIKETYLYGQPDHCGEVMVEVEDTCDAMYNIALKATTTEIV